MVEKRKKKKQEYKKKSGVFFLSSDGNSGRENPGRARGGGVGIRSSIRSSGSIRSSIRSIRSSGSIRSGSSSGRPRGVSSPAGPPRPALLHKADRKPPAAASLAAAAALAAVAAKDGPPHRGLDLPPGLGVAAAGVALEDDLAQSGGGAGVVAVAVRCEGPGKGGGDALAPAAGGPAADAAKLDPLQPTAAAAAPPPEPALSSSGDVVTVLLHLIFVSRGRRRGGGEGAGDCGCGLLGRQPVERQRPQLAAEGSGPAKAQAARGERGPLRCRSC